MKKVFMFLIVGMMLAISPCTMHASIGIAPAEFKMSDIPLGMVLVIFGIGMCVGCLVTLRILSEFRKYQEKKESENSLVE